MWNAVMDGHLCDFGDGDPRRLTSPDDWGPERTVRGWALTALLAHVGAARPPAIRKIQVHGARIVGRVDLSQADLTPVFLVRCLFEDELDLCLASARTLVFETCALASVNAAGASISGTLVILRSLVRGTISLNDARISRSVVFSGSRIFGRGGWAIVADGLEVGSDLMLDKGFLATGSVQLLGARISGNLTCSGGLFVNPGGRALAADSAVIGGSVFLNCPPDSGVGFLAVGTVQLPGAKIASQLICHGGRFYNKRGDALAADGVEVSVGIFLSEVPGGTGRFHATGAVRLLGAKIGGQLNCIGGRFENPGSNALVADGIEIRGNAQLGDGFHATGAVSLHGAQISDDLSCSGGQFEHFGGIALSANRAEIGGQLNCSGGQFESPQGVVLSLQETRARSLRLRDLSPRTAGLIDLIGAKVALLVDDCKILTNPRLFFRLDGFSYERIAQTSPRSAKSRLKWLGLQGPEYFPQPYDQLAEVFRREGQENEATEVLIQKLRKRREVLPSQWQKCWDRFLDCSVRYGWQAWRPLVGGTAIFLLVFALVVAAQAVGLNVAIADATASYHPFMHALDAFLPIVDLGIESRWAIDTLNGGTFSWLVRVSLWVLPVVGWISVTLAVAAFTGIVKRE